MQRILILTLFLFGIFQGILCLDNHIHRSRDIFLHNRVIDTTSTEAFSDFQLQGEQLFYVTFKLKIAGDKKLVDQIADEYLIQFDSFLPVATYLTYAEVSVIEKLSSDSRVLWVGLVPESDKVPEGMTLDSADYAVHWASAAAHLEPISETFADMVTRMVAKFGNGAFAWDALNGQIAQLHIFDTTQASKIINWVLTKGSSRIVFIEPVITNEKHGMYANHVVVDGFWTCNNADPTLCTDYATAVSPQIDGSTQIIGIADTGVNTNNCFFSDPSNNPPFGTLDPNQRKVIAYFVNNGDNKDGSSDGHGTFVAGLATGLAGNAAPAQVADNSRFNGVASGAKLVVNDIQGANTDSLNVNQDTIGTNILQPLYDAGARVSVFPWGSEITQKGKTFYSGQDREFDRWLYSNPDFLAVVSSGNNGLAGPGRVASPASAKNTLAVGGSLNAHTSFEFTDYIPNLNEVASSLHVQYCTIGKTSAYQNPVFCGSLNQPTPCASFQNAFCAGFTGTPDTCCGYTYMAPLCCPETVLRLWQSSTAIYSENSGYPQSSRGPTYDFRIKPDVVAPAQRLYAALNSLTATASYCGIWTDNPESSPDQAATVNEGTSGAAGVVTGAAALVRQWLTQGYFPGGAAGATNYPNPSAALLKAMLINSGDSLYQLNTNGDAHYVSLINDIPSYTQGFGRVNLANVIGVGTNVPDQMVILDNQVISGTGDQLRYCINVPNGNRYLRITAVWTDPAAAVNAGVALVNNIDLVLIRDDGYEYRANGKIEFDSVNNVEDIYVKVIPGRLYAVALYGAYVPNGPQSVALVIRGDLNCPGTGDCLYDTSLCTGNYRCPLDCSLRGTCNNSICECRSPYQGIDCSLTPCPNSCSGNGACNTETGACVCNDFWQGSDCSVANPSGQPPNNTYIVNNKNCNDGVDIGITIGVSIGCFFLGALIFFLFGAWLATRVMLQKKKKLFAKMKQIHQQQQNQAHQPLRNDRIEPDDDEEN